MKIVSINCPNCNAALDFDLDDSKVFCPYCGQKLMIDYEEMSQLYIEKENTLQEQEKTKRVQLVTDYKKKRLLLIGIICAGISVAAAAFLMTTGNSDKATDNTPTTPYADVTKYLSESASDSLNADPSLSSKQLEQVTNPSEKFILKRLSDVSHITDMEAVTEGNDPNGNLNKAGGYTSCVYFSTDLLDQSEIYGNSVIDKGTDGGGSVEVYPTARDAYTRNEYLSVFDSSSVLNSGSHTVLGTIVIRTSRNLTASQQKQLEQEIYDSFIEIK